MTFRSSARRCSVGITLVLLLAVAACDPGWSYSVPGGQVVMDNGREFELAGPSQISLRVHASVFTSFLNTGFMIKNEGTAPLAVRPTQIRMMNREGNALPLKSPVSPCTEHGTQDEISLLPGASCQVHATFDVTPDPDRLKTLTMIHEGVTRNGVALPISVTFEKE